MLNYTFVKEQESKGCCVIITGVKRDRKELKSERVHTCLCFTGRVDFVIIVIIMLGLPIKPPHHAIHLIAGFSLSGFTGTSYQCQKSMTVPRTAVFKYIHRTCISILTQLMVEV